MMSLLSMMTMKMICVSKLNSVASEIAQYHRLLSGQVHTEFSLWNPSGILIKEIGFPYHPEWGNKGKIFPTYSKQTECCTLL